MIWDPWPILCSGQSYPVRLQRWDFLSPLPPSIVHLTSLFRAGESENNGEDVRGVSYQLSYLLSAGGKVGSHRTWRMQTSSHCTRTKETWATAITTVVSPQHCRETAGPCCAEETPGACRQSLSIQNHSVDFELIDPPLTWYSPSDGCRRNVGKNNRHSLWPS